MLIFFPIISPFSRLLDYNFPFKTKHDKNWFFSSSAKRAYSFLLTCLENYDIFDSVLKIDKCLKHDVVCMCELCLQNHCSKRHENSIRMLAVKKRSALYKYRLIIP